MKEQIIVLKEQRDVVNARQAGRVLAKTLGFGTADQTRLATAISEIARNAIQYGGSGTCVIIGHENPRERIIKIVVEDQGGGIKDIDQAMKDGFTTSRGLGAGLPGAKRLMHTFDIHSEFGKGTTVTMTMSRKILK